MASADLKGDAIAVFTENRDLILGVVGAAVVLLLLTALFGASVFGGLMLVASSLISLAVGAFVLWLFYRLVVALERIAGAHERIASAQFQAELEDGVPSEKGTGATFGDSTERDESANDESDESV